MKHEAKTKKPHKNDVVIAVHNLIIRLCGVADMPDDVNSITGLVSLYDKMTSVQSVVKE